MPKKAKELSAVEIRRITKPGLHAVGGVAGLLLQVSGTNGRSWILRTMVGAKRRDIGLGGFPDVPLAVAREKAREVKDQILVGRDPIAVKKAARRAILAEQAKTMTFGEAARQCHSVRSQEFTNEKHKRQWLSSLENYAFPMLEDISVADVDLPHILKILEPIWMTKTETATRVRQRIEAVLTWAKVSGFRTGDNPARWEGNLKEVLPTPSKVADKKHFPALPWEKVPSFFLDLRKQNGTGPKALEFAILTAARSQEVRFATWSEIDIEQRVWTIPGSKMKGKKVHRVPLTDDAINLISALPKFEGCDFLFASRKRGALSDMTMRSVCIRMKADAVPHGFRSSFKDWARNCTSFDDEVSELALAHVNSDKTRAAYARDELLNPRREMMNQWCHFLNNGQVRSVGYKAFE